MKGNGCGANTRKGTRATRWFLEPLNASTNEIAIMELVNLCGATDEKIYRGKKDNRGKSHNVVEVDHAFIAIVERNAEKYKMQFRVYSQEEGRNTMRLWIFGGKGSLGRTREIERMKSQLGYLAMLRGHSA